MGNIVSISVSVEVAAWKKPLSKSGIGTSSKFLQPYILFSQHLIMYAIDNGVEQGTRASLSAYIIQARLGSMHLINDLSYGDLCKQKGAKWKGLHCEECECSTNAGV